jgi:hypothetical protein
MDVRCHPGREGRGQYLKRVLGSRRQRQRPYRGHVLPTGVRRDVRLNRQEPPRAVSIESDAGRTSRRPGALRRIKAFDVPEQRRLEIFRQRLPRDDGATDPALPFGRIFHAPHVQLRRSRARDTAAKTHNCQHQPFSKPVHFHSAYIVMRSRDMLSPGISSETVWHWRCGEEQSAPQATARNHRVAVSAKLLRENNYLTLHALVIVKSAGVREHPGLRKGHSKPCNPQRRLRQPNAFLRGDAQETRVHVVGR